MPYFVGDPPFCRPECVTNSECSLSKACVNNKCVDPCENTCGLNTICTVRYHFPNCKCKSGFTGNPLSSCFYVKSMTFSLNIPNFLLNNHVSDDVPDTQVTYTPVPVRSPEPSCLPNPCGPFSQCRIHDNKVLSCSCLPSYIGNPPNCRPECITSNDCPNNKACQNNLCKNPCEGACGRGAQCDVVYHKAVCTCQPNLIGDPYRNCYPRISSGKIVGDLFSFFITVFRSPDPEPNIITECGQNTVFRNNRCECIPNYIGDPHRNCHPVCISNSDCPRSKACKNNNCVDPCVNACADQATCEVINHYEYCSCPPGTFGDPLISCRKRPTFGTCFVSLFFKNLLLITLPAT